MRIEIIGRKYDVSDKLHDVISKKIEKHLGHYFTDENTARVVCKEDHGKCKMELTINLGDSILRAENTADTMYDNIDIVVPKVERQMRKYRTKISKHLRETIDAPEEASEERIPELVRTKRYKIQKMSIEDAMFQLDVIDSNFFIFINKENDMVTVAYKRDDGDVGIIEAII